MTPVIAQGAPPVEASPPREQAERSFHQRFRARLRTLRSIATPHASGPDLDVPDPISHGPERYAAVYELIAAGCEALLDELNLQA